jgi:tetratricopeptide (TPR) repeat protein
LKKNPKELLLDAEAAIAKGDVSGAEELLLSILRRYPKHGKAKTGLKDLERKKRSNEIWPVRNDVGIEELERVRSLLNAGDYQSAANEAARLLVLAKDVPALHNLSGTALYHLGKTSAAEKAFLAAVTLDDSFAEARISLGWSQYELGKLIEAEQTLVKAISASPTSVNATLNLANVRSDLGKSTLAEGGFRDVLSREPGSIRAITGLRIALTAQGKTEEAEQFLKEAVRGNPSAHEVKSQLALHFAETGDLAQARTYYSEILDDRPTDAEAHLSYAQLHKFCDDDAPFRRLKAATSANSDDLYAKATILFALGKAYEDQGEFADSFDSIEQANAILRKSLSYNPKQIDSQFDRLITRFDVKTINQVSLPQSDFRSPIFIVGLPRSGTTLTEMLIANHPKVTAGGELWTLPDFFTNSAEVLQKPTQASIQKLAAYVQARTENLMQGRELITDKNPLNFRWCGPIAAAFSDVKIIHIKRDPIATGFSIYKNRFGDESLDFSYDLGDIRHYTTAYQRVMDHWESQLGDRILTVEYEDLVNDPAQQLRRICTYCGLEWRDEMVDLGRTKSSIRTASVGQARGEIYKGSIESWRNFEPYLQGKLFE